MAITKTNTLFLLFSLFSIWVVSNAAPATPHAAPAPSVDCMTVVLSLTDCLSYVSAGSTVKKPEGTCCSGLKTVLKSDPECLCEAFKNSAQIGVPLNMTKALGLPSACHVSAPSVSNCGASLVPGAAPALSPTATTSTTSVAGANEIAPAPAPGSSGSVALTISVGSLVLALVVASFSSI